MFMVKRGLTLPCGHRAPSRGSRNWEPIPWTTYFERELFLTPDTTGSTGDGTPSTSSITYHAYLNSPSPSGGPLFVTHHGAGSSGLSFALLAAEIRRLLPNAGILSLDARGHGSTTIMPASTGSPGKAAEVDLSLPTLTDDLYNTINLTQRQMSWPDIPPLVLVGHSLGGAVVTSLAKEPRSLSSKILGHAVLDVVEGSAIDALQSMHSYLSTRPSGFASLESAVEWHVRSRTVRNSVSARASVPSLLVLADDAPSPQDTPRDGSDPSASTAVDIPNAAPRPSRPWRWRTDLAATQPFWEGWFVGLSRKFLEARGGKLLLLAGTDRLDTELTIGQMQGKYALQVFPEAGHFIHEDLPEKTAVALADFFRRNDRSALVLPPKVGDLLKQGKRV